MPKGPKSHSKRREQKTGLAARPEADDQVQRFVQSLSSEERMLVVLKHELYEGSWDEMIADLKARLGGGPYIFKLASRIVEDLERINRLRQFELANKVDLSQFVQMES